MKLLSFLIPVFRNEESLDSLKENLDKISTKLGPDLATEYFFVDDGSDDDSLKIILKYQETDDRVKVISMSRNFGQVNALVAGLKEVKGDAVIVLSADGQEPLEMIDKMLKSWQENNEVVICYRSGRNDPVLSKIGSKLFYNLIKIDIPTIPRGGFDFLLLDRKAIDGLNSMEMKNRFLQGDILWMGFNVKFIPYVRLKRKAGKSQWHLRKKLSYFWDGILNTSYWPIRMMSAIGFFTFTAGGLYAVAIVFLKIFEKTPFTGWAPIMILVMMIGGLNLVMLGLVGEYIWRIYDETKRRPGYIVKDKYLSKEDQR